MTEEFVRLAEVLAERVKSNELEECRRAALRSAVSRAYYSAFHAAKEYIQKRFNAVSPGRGEHEWVVRTLREKDGKRIKFANRLSQLAYSRANADYKLEWSDQALEDAVPHAISEAKQLIQVYALKSH